MEFGTPSEKINKDNENQKNEVVEDEKLAKMKELTCQYSELLEEKMKCHLEKEEIVIHIEDLKKELENETDKERVIQMQEQIIEFYENYETLTKKKADISYKMALILLQENRIVEAEQAEQEELAI